MRISKEAVKARDAFVRRQFKEAAPKTPTLKSINELVKKEFGVGMAFDRIERIRLKKSPSKKAQKVKKAARETFTVADNVDSIVREIVRDEIHNILRKVLHG